jgi:hypothetical protein
MHYYRDVKGGTYKKKTKKLQSCHHIFIRQILKIKWNQVREQRIKNSQVRRLFCNIPNIEAFVKRRTAQCVGKIINLPEDMLPKKILGAWIPQPRKFGQPQLSCNNNFARTLQKILPELIKTRKAAFKDWLQV